MSKALRFALMLALVALAAWTSTPKAAYALAVCSNLSNRACFKPNQTIGCTLAGGDLSFCLCDPDTHAWDCFF